MTKNNRKFKVFFQMDPLSDLNEQTDSTIAIIKEAIKLGLEIWIGLPKDIFYSNTKVSIKGRKILNKDLKLSSPKTLKIDELDFYFIRQDPPFDLRYLSNCYILEIHKKFNEKPFFVNDPSGIKNFTEKIFPIFFADLIPKTFITEDQQTFLKLLQKHKNVVLKTLYNKGGEGVEKVSSKNFRSAIRSFNNLIETYSVPVVIQEFISKVKFGDKRVILLDGDPVGYINRVPESGNFKANLHLGGTAESTKLTKKEKAICKNLKQTLIKEKLFFVGIDLINEQLTEINVTSPTGIVQIFEKSKINVATELWKRLFKKLD